MASLAEQNVFIDIKLCFSFPLWCKNVVGWEVIFQACPALLMGRSLGCVASERGKRGEKVISEEGFLEGCCGGLSWAPASGCDESP